MTPEERTAQLKSYPLLQVIDVPITLLASSEYNPREFKSDEDREALKKSLTEDPDFMTARPIIVNVHEGREGVIIAGDKRFICAAELEWSTVPAMFVNVPIEKEKAWNLKDNIHNGKWVPEKRKELMSELQELGYDMGTIGFTGGEVVDIMGGIDISGDPKNDPDYKGTTPSTKRAKAKIMEGQEITCPHCNTVFTFGVKMETQGD